MLNFFAVPNAGSNFQPSCAPAAAFRMVDLSKVAGADDRNKIDFHCLTTHAAFNALEAEWNDLFMRSGPNTTAFQSFNWLWHWCNHFLSDDEQNPARTRLAIVAGRRNGRLTMVWPLAIETVGGIEKLIWMGDPVSQYGDVLAEESPDREDLLLHAWTYIQRTTEADVIRLRKVRSDSIIAPVFARTEAFISETRAAPYLDLASAPNSEAYEQRYAGKTRKNRRRLRRRFEEQGPADIAMHQPGPEAAALTRKALELKREWLSRRNMVPTALADPRVDQFFNSVTSDGSHDTGCRVSVLKSAATPAAIEIAFRSGDHLAVHLIVYDEAFEKSGAGVILMEESMRRSHAAGIATFDLLAPADAYKMDWADGATEVHDWALPLTLKGHAYTRLYLGFARSRIKAAMASMPGACQTILNR